MGLVEDIVEGFGGVAETGETTSTILIYAIFGLIFFFGGLGVFALVRWIVSKLQYPSGESIAPVRLLWMGSSAYVEGNLSRDDSFSEEKLEKINEYYDGENLDWKTIEDMIDKKKLFTYKLKITDEVDELDNDDDTVGILSSKKLESEEYSWLDRKGKRGITSVWTPVKRRNIMVHDSSRQIKSYDDDGHPIYWWAINPIKIGVKKQEYYRAGVFDGEYFNIEISKIENAKGIIDQANISTTFAEAIEKNNYLDKESKRFQNLYEDTLKKLTQKNIENNNLKESLAQKKYIEHPEDIEEPKESNPLMWIVIGVFMSGILAFMMPEIVPSHIDDSMAYFGGLFIGLLITVFGYNYVKSKNEQKPMKKSEMIED